MSKTVYLPKNRFGKDKKVYHTDPECHHLRQAEAVREVDVDVLFEDFRECSGPKCGGTRDPCGGTGAGHYQSIVAAANSDEGSA